MLAVLASVGGLAGALVGAHLVGAAASVLADGRRDVALVHVLLAVGAVEAGRAAADVVGFEGDALAPVGTGVGGAGVGLLAAFTWGGREEEEEEGEDANHSSWRTTTLCSSGVQLTPPTFTLLKPPPVWDFCSSPATSTPSTANPLLSQSCSTSGSINQHRGSFPGATPSEVTSIPAPHSGLT